MMNYEKAEKFLISFLENLKQARKRWCSDCADDAEEMWLEYPQNILSWISEVEDCLELSPSPISIISATYGFENKIKDVREIMFEKLLYKKMNNIEINNYSMEGDPAPNLPKKLNLKYLYNGVEKNVIVKEGQILKIEEQDLECT